MWEKIIKRPKTKVGKSKVAGLELGTLCKVDQA